MRRTCPVCTVSFEANDVGRPRRWCSARCRQRAHVARKAGTPPGGTAIRHATKDDQAAGEPRDVALPRVFGGARLVPGTESHARAWRLNPRAIYDGLTEAERHDPGLNPLHRYADSWLAGRQGEWLQEVTRKQRLLSDLNAKQRRY